MSARRDWLCRLCLTRDTRTVLGHVSPLSAQSGGSILDLPVDAAYELAFDGRGVRVRCPECEAAREWRGRATAVIVGATRPHVVRPRGPRMVR